MSTTKPIRSALISVFHKDGLKPVIELLQKLGVTIYSTGGTQSFIEKLGAEVVAVESLTDYPSILGGRVKTLHPKVFGGILARREESGDLAQLEEYSIPEIDLIIVDLYPFEQTVAETNDEQSIIEKIDIGGISLIRAGAKNFKDTLVVSSRDEYAELVETLENGNGSTSLEERQRFATRAFAVSSNYDTAIFHYFNRKAGLDRFRLSFEQSQSLRYGENPHQAGTFYGNLDEVFDKLHGKELSYNNLVDVDAAVNLIREFDDPTFVVIKHTNSCGVASRDNLLDAWKDALAGDPVSAFGGIIVTNRKIEKDVAEEIHKLFCEVLIAPNFSDEALEILKGKKNRIILRQKLPIRQDKMFKSLLNGVIEQDTDLSMEAANQMSTVTKLAPTSEQLVDLEFANKVVKHLKSNTIVLAKGKQLLGMGCGQTSRVDALKQAIIKAEAFGFSLHGSVMASDAFFPFPDCVEIADKAGIKAVIQPGGSIRDKDSIDYCDEHGMAMVTTGVRHFKH